MIPILKKEITNFFSQLSGYLIIGIFILFTGLLHWVLKGNSNFLTTGYADMIPFFYNCSWLFVFLIPAITMKSFAEEYKNGTIEILKTLPISSFQIVLGKYLAYVSIIVLCLLPTSIYVISLFQLGNPIGSIDLGVVISSYIGLVFLGATYAAIGIFSSILAKNTISGFAIATITSATLFFGFHELGNLINNSNLQSLGIQYHFESIQRGVIDIKDCVYFFSISILFLVFTKNILSHEK